MEILNSLDLVRELDILIESSSTARKRRENTHDDDDEDEFGQFNDDDDEYKSSRSPETRESSTSSSSSGISESTNSTYSSNNLLIPKPTSTRAKRRRSGIDTDLLIRKAREKIDNSENGADDDSNDLQLLIAQTLLLMIMRRSNPGEKRRRTRPNRPAVVVDSLDSTSSTESTIIPRFCTIKTPIDIPDIDDPFLFIDNIYEQILRNDNTHKTSSPREADRSIEQPSMFTNDFSFIDLYSNQSRPSLNSTMRYDEIEHSGDDAVVWKNGNLFDWNLDETILDHYCEDQHSSITNPTSSSQAKEEVTFNETAAEHRGGGGGGGDRDILAESFEFVRKRKSVFIFPILLMFLNSRLKHFSLVLTISNTNVTRTGLASLAESVVDGVKSCLTSFVNIFVSHFV